MANSLANRATVDRTLSLFKLASSFFRARSFSAAAAASDSFSNPSAASKKPKRKKKKNLFEVIQFLPNWGIGYHMAKTHWTGVSYEITKINLYKDGRHGKAWGIVHKEGLPPAEAPKKMSGVHKRCWRYIPSLSKPLRAIKPRESAPKAEPQAV